MPAVQIGWELLVANVGDSLAFLDTGNEIIQVRCSVFRTAQHRPAGAVGLAATVREYALKWTSGSLQTYCVGSDAPIMYTTLSSDA